jgi:TolA-binding protein
MASVQPWPANMKGVPYLWTEQRVVAPACGIIDVQIRRVHVEVAHQHDGYVQLKQFRRVAIQAPEPAEFIVELRAGRWVAIRQMQASDQHAVDGRLYIAALIVVGVARKAAPDRALLLNPNSARTLQRGAWNSFYNRQYDEAVDRFRASIRASPLDPLNYNASFGIGCAFFGKECDEAAVEWLEAAMATRPSATFVHRVLERFRFNRGHSLRL